MKEMYLRPSIANLTGKVGLVPGIFGAFAAAATTATVAGKAIKSVMGSSNIISRRFSLQNRESVIA